jgi:hypothetical protein
VSAKLSSPQAQRLVEARLGREPQDMLEAAVVLEAWVGTPARDALGTGQALMHTSERVSQPSVGRPPRRVDDEDDGFAFEAIAFIITVIAIACWADPLADDLGTGVVERGLIVALPLTLTLQWGLRSRYLGRVHGLAQLGRRPASLVIAILALIAAPSALLGVSGTVAGLLTLTWTAGILVIRRGWAAGYAAAVVLATAGMLAGLPAAAVLAAVAGATCVAAAAAMRSKREVLRHPSGRWLRTLLAAAIGAGLGLLLVGDRTVDWSVGPAPALALLPSSLASFWGGYHLWQFQYVIPRALSGVPAFGPKVSGLHWPPLRILLGSVARLVLGTAVLSAALVLGAEWAGAEMTGVSVLVGFGFIGLATLLVSLLESVGRAPWALAAVVCAVAGEAVVSRWDGVSTTGLGLIVGSALAVLVALPIAIAVLSRPARTLATALWIP